MTLHRDSTATNEVLRNADVGSVNIAFAERRQVIYRRLRDGDSGAQVLGALTEVVDDLVISRYHQAVRQMGQQAVTAALQQCCLVALGGYGRRELAPYSDIDLMFVFQPEAGRVVPELVTHVLHPLWDIGLQVGHSVRTIQDCVSLARTDVTIRTSQMEARFLTGSRQLFQKFYDRYLRQVVARGVDRFIGQKIEERRHEYEKFGETVYLLEPNVKKSKGGLRDLHLLQWVGMARYGAGTILELSDRGSLSRQDYQALNEARRFLWHVRALMHVHAGRAQEVLSFDEQVWLAERFGYQDLPHLLAVEQFMQQYYRHTMGLHELCSRFVNRCRSVPVWRRVTRLLPSPRLHGVFVVQGGLLTVPAELKVRLLDSPELLLQLFDLARARGLAIDPILLEDIHRHVETVSEEAFRTSEVSRIFLNILSGPRTAAVLEAMHRAHLLEKIIPVFSRVRGLMQFNQYHKYTVDEHSLLAVAKAEALASEPGVLAEVYREIHRKDILHLAVLLHDLGKGLEEDHSKVGRAIAEDLAARLGFDEQETRTLVLLVHRHLLMAHTAFRRDPYDEKVLLGFARAVGTPEVLRKLLILTAADIAAVGPGMMTKWKESLLLELYLRTLAEVSGEREEIHGAERLRQLAGDVAREASNTVQVRMEVPWIESQLAQFPLRYVYGTSPQRIATHLAAIKQLCANEVRVEEHFNGSLGTCEYTVVTFNDLTPGIFSKIAGVMAAKGLQIFDAQIITRDDGVVADTFQVLDPDFVGPPPPERCTSIARAIVRVLKGEEGVEQLVEQSSRLPAGSPMPAHRQPTEVQVDNETSDRFTIIDVFADDRQGLLYIMGYAVFALGLSVHAARISTRLDQVADVFYVTDLSGNKIEDHARLEVIRASIKEEIDRFLAGQEAQPASISSEFIA